jgi:hypothetical protein
VRRNFMSIDVAAIEHAEGRGVDNPLEWQDETKSHERMLQLKRRVCRTG